MAKIKFTKGELKKQRDSLKQFKHYLPTLQLKKQQLQMKILEVRRALEECQKKIGQKEHSFGSWIGLLADLRVDIGVWLKPKEVVIDYTNIAGANIPVYRETVFSPPDYDLYLTPFWVDQALEELWMYISLLAEAIVIRKQAEVLEKELRITTQRVNLFEKIKIPECNENIRRIKIYLGDQQANAVGIGKVAKKKVEEKSLELALV